MSMESIVQSNWYVVTNSTLLDSCSLHHHSFYFLDVPSSSSSMVQVSDNTSKVAPKDNLEKLPRPPLKRRHPVSKKGPSKKSSPAVVLKNGSAGNF